jgi:hypothetical protein
MGTRKIDYPGKAEILAAWRWGISHRDQAPITTMGEATDAMSLAYQAFRERDEARAALGSLPEELAGSKREADRLRAECRKALAERDAHKKLAADANRELKVAQDQRTLAVILAAIASLAAAIISAVAL